MTFVDEVNPFAGIICCPYYYLWIVVILSWSIFIPQIFYLKWVNKTEANIWKSSKYKGYNKVSNAYRVALESATWNGQELPVEVIQVILDLLPGLTVISRSSPKGPDVIWSITQTEASRDKIKRKSLLLHFSKLTYSIIKIIANFANFIIILSRYRSWYNDHEYFSNWRKYCAFIIAMIYMPSFKLNSFLNVIHVDALAWITKANISIDIIFLIWFGIVSFPIILTGVFIFIPFTCVYIAVLYTAHLNKIKHHSSHIINIVNALMLSLGTMSFILLIVILTIEFYGSDSGYGNTYGIVLTGKYCDENDMFKSWSEYPTDIQYLIISWILF